MDIATTTAPFGRLARSTAGTLLVGASLLGTPTALSLAVATPALTSPTVAAQDPAPRPSEQGASTRGRGQRRRMGRMNEWAITPELQSAVRRGLAWLAEHQHPDGYWAQDVGYKLNTDYRVTTHEAAHIGVTALALISFMAGGHLPRRGKYGKVIDRGLDYILRNVNEWGYISDNESRMYSHAFATLFLAEIYGQTRRRDVRDALQKSVNLIVDSQNTEGGWRYRPFARQSDMSITVCQVIALRSARNVGITVPKRTIEDATKYVRRSAVQDGYRRRRAFRMNYGDEGGAFRYQLGRYSRATFSLTSAGVTALHAAGYYDLPEVQRGIDFLSDRLGDFNSTFRGHYFFYYGHYYAVQAFYIHGGSHFQSYFREIRSVLLDMQQSSGAFPCHTGPGEAFSTAVATLILQIPYQFLPIFQR